MSDSTSYDALLRELATDLDGAFEQLVLAFQGRLYGFALRLSGDRRDAEEIAQDAFIRAYRALRGYDRDRIITLALRAWLYQIALNVARNRARGTRVRIIPLTITDEDGERETTSLADDEQTRPEAQLERLETGERLGAALAALPDRYRAAVILRHVEGLPYPELATVLKQPLGTVKANVHRGIGLLRTRLRAEEEDYAAR